MRRLRPILLALVLLVQAWPASAAITLLATCGSPGGATVCSGSGISTTGATLLVAVNGTNAASCPTDSQSNTWTAITNASGGGFGGTSQICYVNNPSTSGSHTFTCAGALCGVTVGAYSGTDTSGPLDTFCAAGANKCAASVTPANSGSLIVAGTGGPFTAPLAIDSGLTIQQQVPGAGGVSYGSDFADLIQGAAAAIQPAWSDATGPGGIGIALVAVFKPGGGGGGSPVPKCSGGLLLRGVGCQAQP